MSEFFFGGGSLLDEMDNPFMLIESIFVDVWQNIFWSSE